MEVIINGTRYVPVIESSTDMKAITRGLLESFWGHISLDDDLKEKMDGITISVNDDCRGETIEYILESIAKELNRK